MDDDKGQAGRAPRDTSRRSVLRELASGAALSGPEIVGRTGLTRATVATVLERLAAEGRVARQGRGLAVKGRPAQLWRLAGSDGVVGGIDLGHSHLTVALATPNGEVVDQHTVDRDIDQSGRASVRAAVDALQALMARNEQAEVSAVAVGVPGPLERLRDGGVRAGGVMAGWADVDPLTLIRTHFPPSTAVVVENDAHLGAIGEHAYGAARGLTTALFVKIGSGIGAGIIVDKVLYRGGHGTAGEIGHIRVSPQGDPCRCGSRGCLETVAAVPVVLTAMRRVHGPDLSLADVAHLLEIADPTAVRLFTDVGETVGQVLAGTVTSLDPELVVVGSPIPENTVLTGAIESALRRTAHPFVARNARVVAGELGAQASIRGALARAGRIARINAQA